MRTISCLTLCGVLVGCQGFKGAQSEPVPDHRALASIQSIFVADLGQEDEAHLLEASAAVREKISAGLSRSGRFSLVQDPQQADAVLAGLAGLERWYHGMEGYYGMEGDLDSHELGVGTLRLFDSKTKHIIWTHEYKTGFLRPTQTVAERVAEQVAEQLVHDASYTVHDGLNTHK